MAMPRFRCRRMEMFWFLATDTSKAPEWAFWQTNWKKRFFILPKPKGTMAKRLRLYYYLQAGDKAPRGMFDLNPNSLVLKVEQHSTSPAVADGDHAKLYPISIFERAATKDENIRDAESRGKALRLYLLSEQDREAWVHGITEGIKFLKDPSTSGLTAPATVRGRG